MDPAHAVFPAHARDLFAFCRCLRRTAGHGIRRDADRHDLHHDAGAGRDKVWVPLQRRHHPARSSRRSVTSGKTDRSVSLSVGFGIPRWTTPVDRSGLQDHRLAALHSDVNPRGIGKEEECRGFQKVRFLRARPEPALSGPPALTGDFDAQVSQRPSVRLHAPRASSPTADERRGHACVGYCGGRCRRLTTDRPLHSVQVRSAAYTPSLFHDTVPSDPDRFQQRSKQNFSPRSGSG